jgi:hypothetical protein
MEGALGLKVYSLSILTSFRTLMKFSLLALPIFQNIGFLEPRLKIFVTVEILVAVNVKMFSWV